MVPLSDKDLYFGIFLAYFGGAGYGRGSLQRSTAGWAEDDSHFGAIVQIFRSLAPVQGPSRISLFHSEE